MEGAAKLDYLKRYVTKKTKIEQKANNQFKIIDEELDSVRQNIEEDEQDEQPQFVETNDSSRLTNEEKAAAVSLGSFSTMKMKTSSFNKAKSGVWSSVDDAKKQQARQSRAEQEIKMTKDESSSGSSDEEPARGKRRSDDDDNTNNETADQSKSDKREAEQVERMKDKMRKALGVEESQDKRRQPTTDKDGDLSPLRQNLDSKSAYGVKSITEIKLENKRAKEKEQKLQQLADQFKDSGTIYRDKEGRKIDIVQDLESKKQELLKKNEQRISEWGSGLVQKGEAENRRKELQAMKRDGFAQYELAKEQDMKMMDNERFGDPMSRAMAEEKKQPTRPKSSSVKLKCKFPGNPNRFGIHPGYRWDGVDRGTGFESKMMHTSNTQKAQQETAKVWSMREL